MRSVWVSGSLAALLLAPGLCAVKTSNLRTRQWNATALQPCFKVLIARATNQTDVDAQLAYDCVQSSPIDINQEVALIDQLKDYVEVQSNLAYIKNPPIDYAAYNPPVDILASLDNLKEKVKGGEYKAEYHFAVDLYNLVQSAHDGHLAYRLNIVNVFQFRRPVEIALVSVSKDGKSLPELFTLLDVKAMVESPGFKASPVVAINGQDATEFLVNGAQVPRLFHDPDAMFNALLGSDPQRKFGHFIRPTLYPGSNTTLTFQNNTEKTFGNRALLPKAPANLTAIQALLDSSKRDLKADLEENSFEGWLDSSLKRPILFDPEPTVPHPALSRRDYEDYVASYSLEGDEYKDVVVLDIYQFSPGLPGSPKAMNASVGLIAMEATVREFLKTAAASQKKKLIIDLRGNLGGYVNFGLDVFHQIFPDVDMAADVRMRSTPLLQDAAKFYWQSLSNETAKSEIHNRFLGKIFGKYLNQDGGSFSGPEDFFENDSIDRDNFTSLLRYNLTDMELSPPSGQVFEPSNVVLLHDGLCASMCADFSELMKSFVGVRSIAVGGRPQNGPMQGIGATKGGEVWEMSTIFRVALATKLSAGNDTSLLSPMTQRLSNATMPVVRALSASVNLQNAIRRDDSTSTPLQFVYEPSDCRIWYTPDMVFDPKVVYKRVADAMWGKGECVEGSQNVRGSLSSGDIKVDVKYPNLDLKINWMYPENENFTLSTSSVLTKH